MRVMLLVPGNSMHSLPWIEALGDAGHECLVYAYPPVTQDFGSPQVRVVQGRGPLGRASWLRRAIRQDMPDIATLHYVGSDAYFLAKQDVPLVLSAWGSDIAVDLSGRPLKRWAIAQALRKAELVVSPGRHITAALTELGASPERILTAQYGVDTSRFAPRDSGPALPPVRVICTRAMRPIYGNEDLVRAAPALSAGGVKEVVFSAGGPLLDEMSSMAGAAAVPVDFLGGVAHESMPDLLRSADIYCSMSRSDGTSLSLLEAMACGLTPVVSDIEANRDWIADRVDGRLVRVDDPQALAAAINEVAADVEFRRRASAAVRDKVCESGDRAKNMRAIVNAVEGIARA